MKECSNKSLKTLLAISESNSSANKSKKNK